MTETPTFPCGHERTAENTKPKAGRPDGRCRACQRRWDAEYQQRRYRDKALMQALAELGEA